MALMAGCFAVQQVIIVHMEKPYDFYFGLNDYGMRNFLLWQVVTYQFLHFGWIHFVLNLAFVWFIGRAVEARFGGRFFLFIFFVPVVAGGVLQGGVALIGSLLPPSMDQAAMFILNRFGESAGGASAGPLGLLAAFCLMQPPQWLSRANGWRVLALAVIVALFLVLVPTTPKVAHLAHLGALLTGILIMLMRKKRHAE